MRTARLLALTALLVPGLTLAGLAVPTGSSPVVAPARAASAAGSGAPAIVLPYAADPSADVEAAPAATVVAGRLHVVEQGPFGTLQHAAGPLSAVGSWTPVTDLGGDLAAAPALASPGPGELVAAATWRDGTVRIRRFTGNTWQPWASLGGVVLGAPSLVATGGGRLVLAVRGARGGLYVRAYDGQAWGRWYSLGGVLTSPPAVGTPGQGRLRVVVRSGGNALWERTWDGRVWSRNWYRLDGVALSSPTVASAPDGAVELLARGTDGGVVRRTNRNGRWGSWTTVPGNLASGPAAVAPYAGDVVLVARMTDGMLSRTELTAQGPAPWSTVPLGVNREMSRDLAPGVTWRTSFDPNGPYAVQVVTATPEATTSLVPALAAGRIGGIARTSAAAVQSGALAAVNGDFFLGGSLRPVHVFAASGRFLKSQSLLGRQFSLDVTRTKSTVGFPSNSVTAQQRRTGYRENVDLVNNGYPLYEQMAAVTDEGDAPGTAAGGCSVRLMPTGSPRLRPDGRATQEFGVDLVDCSGGIVYPDGGTVLVTPGGAPKSGFLQGMTDGDLVDLDWTVGAANSIDTIGGNPSLLEKGKVTDRLDCGDAFCNRNPRTIVGARSDGTLLLVTVDGGQPGWSVGMSLQEEAALMQYLGAVDALNLDGGGSTAMAIEGVLTNRPCCDGGERPVATTLELLPQSRPVPELAPAAPAVVARPTSSPSPVPSPSSTLPGEVASPTATPSPTAGGASRAADRSSGWRSAPNERDPGSTGGLREYESDQH